MASTIKRLWKTRPLLVNCITYGALYGGAELSQQCLIRKAFVSRSDISSHFVALFYHQNTIYISDENINRIIDQYINQQSNKKSQ